MLSNEELQKIKNHVSLNTGNGLQEPALKLIAEVEELKKEVERLKEIAIELNRMHTDESINVLELCEDVDRYRTALKWYADRSLYGTWLVHPPETRIEADGGRRAREALEGSND